MNRFTKLLSFGLLCLPLSAFATPSLVGIWKNIDDQTGFSKGSIEIFQNEDGTYSGKIHEISTRPDYTPKTICDKCSGTNRNKPILGMTVVSNFVNIPNKPLEFAKGTLLDPSSGKVYKAKLRLSSNGKRLNLRGYIGVEIIGRSQTWIRQQ